MGQEPLVYRNIGQQLALAVDKFGDREALVSCHEDVRLTFAEVKERADKLAAGFQKLGLERGDRIAICAPSTSTWYLTMMAAARAGLILVALNPAYQAPEIEYCLQKVNVKAIVAPESHRSQHYYELLSTILPDLKSATEPRPFRTSKLSDISVIMASHKDFK